MQTSGTIMKKLLLISAILLMASSFYGCLIFHKMSYTINIDKENTGTATVVFYDIRSDADNKTRLEDDKTNLFYTAYKSSDFVDQMKETGKIITKRELYLQGDTLCGKVSFSFQNISNVDSTLMFEDGYYFLTLALDDSVLSTNGLIIYSKDRKRIIWDRKDKQLKYEMLGNPYDGSAFTKLSPFFKSRE